MILRPLDITTDSLLRPFMSHTKHLMLM